MPFLVITSTSQLVFWGGIIWVTNRSVLDQLSWATPARWGYAASASTIDTHRLVAGPTDPKDQHWDHKASAWLFDMGCSGLVHRLQRHRVVEDPAQAMSRPAQPVLTVRAPQSEGSFAPGRDVVVGSDVCADLRVAHPLIARAHLLLRFDQGRWMAIDNNSLNGMFANGRTPKPQPRPAGCPAAAHFRRRTSPGSGRFAAVDDGVDPHHHTAPAAGTSAARQTPEPRRAAHHGGSDDPAQRRDPAVPQVRAPVRTLDHAGPDRSRARQRNRPPCWRRATTPGHGSDTQGRAEIRDAGSINGTFVNENGRTAPLRNNGDVATIGNVDLLLRAPARRQEVATLGGLEVRDVDFAINGKNLLEKELSAKPAAPTALIGGSGAGKSTPSAADRRIHHTHLRGGHLRGPQHPDGRTRIGMVPQDDVVYCQLTPTRRSATPPSCGCLILQCATGRRPGARRAGPDQARRHPGRQAVRRAAQARLGGPGAALRAMRILYPAHLRPGSRTGSAGHDDAAAAGRRRSRRAGGDALAELPRVRPTPARWQPGGKTAYCGPPDQIGGAMGTTNWAQIFAQGRAPTPTRRSSPLPEPASKPEATAATGGAGRRRPA